MHERFCLRCDWAGEEPASECPRCGAPLYRAGSPRPDERVQPPLEPGAAAPTVPRGRRAPIVLVVLIVLVAAGTALALTRRDGSAPAIALADAGSSSSAAVQTASEDGPDLSTTPTTGQDACPPGSIEDGPRSVPLPQPLGDGPTASADLTADYRFRDSLASAVGTAPDLVEVGRARTWDAEEGLLGPPRGFRFARGVGLELRPTTGVIGRDGYTIELVFRFQTLGGWRKIVDLSGGVGDAGLYAFDGCLNFFDAALAPAATLQEDRFAHVVLTRGPGGTVVGYVDGVEQFAFRNRGWLAVVGRDRALRFFVDDATTDTEDSGGAVSRIRLYDGPLAADEVARLACAALPALTCEQTEHG